MFQALGIVFGVLVLSIVLYFSYGKLEQIIWPRISGYVMEKEET